MNEPTLKLFGFGNYCLDFENLVIVPYGRDAVRVLPKDGDKYDYHRSAIVRFNEPSSLANRMPAVEFVARSVVEANAYPAFHEANNELDGYNRAVESLAWNRDQAVRATRSAKRYKTADIDFSGKVLQPEVVNGHAVATVAMYGLIGHVILDDSHRRLISFDVRPFLNGKWSARCEYSLASGKVTGGASFDTPDEYLNVVGKMVDYLKAAVDNERGDNLYNHARYIRNVDAAAKHTRIADQQEKELEGVDVAALEQRLQESFESLVSELHAAG